MLVECCDVKWNLPIGSQFFVERFFVFRGHVDISCEIDAE